MNAQQQAKTLLETIEKGWDESMFCEIENNRDSYACELIPAIYSWMNGLDDFSKYQVVSLLKSVMKQPK